MFNHNSKYIEMHLDRLNEELIAEMYGKRDEVEKKKSSNKNDTENEQK